MEGQEVIWAQWGVAASDFDGVRPSIPRHSCHNEVNPQALEVVLYGPILLVRLGVLGMTTIVLVVEDDDCIRECASEAIEAQGFPVRGFATAEAALACLEEGVLDTEAMFTDVCLAGNLDGITLAIAVRVRWPTVRILVTSGDEAIEKSLPAGIAFLLKPWRIPEMLRHLELDRRV